MFTTSYYLSVMTLHKLWRMNLYCEVMTATDVMQCRMLWFSLLHISSDVVKVENQKGFASNHESGITKGTGSSRIEKQQLFFFRLNKHTMMSLLQQLCLICLNRLCPNSLDICRASSSTKYWYSSLIPNWSSTNQFNLICCFIWLAL